MGRSIEELSSLGKNMKDQAKEVDYTIVAAERSLFATRRQLGRGDKDGLARMAATNLLLDDLRTTRTDLQHDILSKTHCLNLDESCRKVTAQMATEKKRQRPMTTGRNLSSSTPTLLGQGASKAGSGSGLGECEFTSLEGGDVDSAASTMCTPGGKTMPKSPNAARPQSASGINGSRSSI